MTLGVSGSGGEAFNFAFELGHNLAESLKLLFFFFKTFIKERHRERSKRRRVSGREGGSLPFWKAGTL